MRDMQGSLSAIASNKFFSYGVRATFLLSPFLYFILWDTMIRYDLLSMMRLPFRILSNTLTGEMARVQVSASPEVVLWRGGWLPVYWSKLGDLTPYHGVFSLAYVIYLGSSIFQQGRRIVRVPSVRNIIWGPETIKKFWIVFGVVAFLTTSLSTVGIIAELFSLIYFLIYIVALPLVPLSSYLWWKRRKTREKSVNEVI